MKPVKNEKIVHQQKQTKVCFTGCTKFFCGSHVCHLFQIITFEPEMLESQRLKRLRY